METVMVAVTPGPELLTKVNVPGVVVDPLATDIEPLVVNVPVWNQSSSPP